MAMPCCATRPRDLDQNYGMSSRSTTLNNWTLRLQDCAEFVPYTQILQQLPFTRPQVSQNDTKIFIGQLPRPFSEEQQNILIRIVYVFEI